MNLVLWCNTGPLADTELFRHACALLSPARQEKVEAFRLEKDKCLSLGAGLLLRCGLQRAGVRDPRIAFTVKGKPYLKDRTDVHFNLSHSGQIAALALSDRPVGIDVQEQKHFTESLIRRVYLPSEQAAAPATERDRYYTLLWTVKESALKWSGDGITLDPRSLCVSSAPDIRVHAEGRKWEALRFTTRALGDCILTVCSAYDPFPGEFEALDAAALTASLQEAAYK